MKHGTKDKLSYFIILGLIGVFGSLFIACLDAIGYFGYPKSFSSAFFNDKRTDFLFDGVQLFHYFFSGATLSALGLSLKCMMKINNPIDSLSLDPNEIISSERMIGKINNAEAIMRNKVGKTEFIPEITVVKGVSSINGIESLKPFHDYQKISPIIYNDFKYDSVESNIDVARAILLIE